MDGEEEAAEKREETFRDRRRTLVDRFKLDPNRKNKTNPTLRPGKGSPTSPNWEELWEKPGKRHRSRNETMIGYKSFSRF